MQTQKHKHANTPKSQERKGGDGTSQWARRRPFGAIYPKTFHSWMMDGRAFGGLLGQNLG